MKPSPFNPRKISRDALRGLGKSVQAFGLVEPIVVNKRTKHIVGGHQRYKALRDAGVKEADVRVVDLSRTREKALCVALNNPHLQCEFTLELQGVLKELQTKEKALFDGLRFAPLDLDGKKEGLTDPDDVPKPPKKAITRKGDLWVLGRHRLLCGDSTKPKDVQRLMAGKKAALCATDPPYGISYYGGSHPESKSNRGKVRDKNWRETYREVKTATAAEFYRGFLEQALTVLAERGLVYIWHADKMQTMLRAIFEELGLLSHQVIIWAKSRPVLIYSHYMQQHEPCLYGWRKGKQPSKSLRPPANERTVWTIEQKGNSSAEHPTQKPVELFGKPIKFHVQSGAIAFEPFSGSGSQIIAAEQLGRRCYAMEIEPRYVDVAVKRWEAFTGKKAKRVKKG